MKKEKIAKHFCCEGCKDHAFSIFSIDSCFFVQCRECRAVYKLIDVIEELK